ncbi:MAG: thioredoxin family protein [Gammaproteobacteria bacterium]|nr:thioredoxin family protein [Gammaproteobacteria bacterium]
MKTTLCKLLFILSFAFSAGSFAAVNHYQQQPVYSQVYSAGSNPFEDGRKALALAKDTDRRVLIEVGGEWCQFCHRLDRFIQNNEDVAARFYNAFVVLKVNYSDENKNTKFLSAFSGINGYPHIFITENNGKVLHSTGPAELSENGKHSRQKFFDFIDRWQLKQKSHE